MSQKVFLSHHAIRRVLSRDVEEGVVRLTMTPDEVQDFLNEDIYVETCQYSIDGKRYNSDIRYWVFYSPKDEYYFVAIGTMNENWGMYEVITVIPANNKRKWMLTNNMLVDAKILALNKIGLPSPTYVATTNQSLKIKCMYVLNGKVKIKKLFDVPADNFVTNIRQAIEKEDFLNRCFNHAECVGINRNRLTSIVASLGKNGVSVSVDVRVASVANWFD